MVSRIIARRAVSLTQRSSLRSSRRNPYPVRGALALARPPLASFAQSRCYSDRSVADEKIEEITELYATAKDEFEIAMEETEKVSVYAEDDRAAATEELGKLQKAYGEIISGTDKELADEVQKRIGQRIRELEAGVKAMHEMAQNQD